MKRVKIFSAAVMVALAGCSMKSDVAGKVDINGFEPVVYRQTATNSFEVSVWGRVYRYCDSVFPVSVKTVGREIFAAPMTLSASFSGKIGKFHSWQYTLVENSDDRVVVLASAHCENVMVNATTTFERDGLARTELKIVPYGYWSLHKMRDYDPTLDKLWFDIDLTAESSTLFHYWPYSENSCVVTSEVNSGVTKTREHPFRAYTWCGWEDGGFGVTCETSAEIELKDMKKCISVTRSEKGTRVRYNLLDDMPSAWKGRRDRWGDALIPLCYEFGLQATPVKARPVGDPNVYRRLHIYELAKERVLENKIPERFGKAGVRYVVFHSTYSRAQGCALVGDKKEFRAIVDAFHRNGVKVLVYIGFEYPTILPGWSKKKDDYLIRHPGGKYIGGWQAETHRAYQSCYASAWADEIRKNVAQVIDEFGLDGIYTDGLHIPWECANERHGCGWRDGKGDLHATYPIYAIRDLARDLHSIVHVRGGTLEAHQSACMITPLLSYVDSCFDGENVQSALESNPEHLPTDAFRCEYSGYAFGLPMTFISYTNEKLTIQMLASMTLVHNLHPVPRAISDLDFVSSVWKIYEQRDLDSAEFVPYWRKNVSDTKDVWCSMYRGKKGELTAVVSNLSKKPKKAVISVGGDFSKAKNLLTGEAIPVANGKLALEFKPFTPYLFGFE